MMVSANEVRASGGVWVPRDASNTVDNMILAEGTTCVDADFVSTTAPDADRNGVSADDEPVSPSESVTPKPATLSLPLTRREGLGRPGYRFELLQQWEGTVQEIGNDELTVHLRDLTNPSQPEELAVLSREEVSADDRALVKPGAVLYWSIGYETTRAGQTKRVSAIRFRRLPAWTRRELEAAQIRADTLVALFGDGTDERNAARTG